MAAGLVGLGATLIGGRSAAAQEGTPGTSNPLATPTQGGTEVDPQMQDVLDKLMELNPIPIQEQTPFNARQLPTPADAAIALLSERGEPAQEPVGAVTHRLIPTPDGQLVSRVYTPAGDGPFPILVYFHGGGWVIANLNSYDASARALCNLADCVVVSVAYRQAPEVPFPGPANDAYNAFQYVAANPNLFGGEAGRVAVGGESAGGNLSIVTSLIARDQGGIAPVHQLLVYPVADYAFDTESYAQYAAAMPLNRPLMEYFWANYLPDPSLDADPTASPLRAADFSGLPPATVIAAEIDPLQSEGRALADALEAAGNDVTYTLYEGVTHEFFGLGALVDKAAQAEQEAADRLTQSFETAGGTPTA